MKDTEVCSNSRACSQDEGSRVGCRTQEDVSTNPVYRARTCTIKRGASESRKIKKVQEKGDRDEEGV